MPGLSGSDVLALVRGDTRLDAVRCVMCTAFATDAYLQLVMSLGADACFFKPFDGKVLVRRICELITLSEAKGTM